MTREELNQEKQSEIFKEQNKEIIKRIVKITIKTIVIITIVSTIFFTYTTYISTLKIHVREYRTIEKELPNDFNGLKIIQFSDLHYGSTMYIEDLKKIVKQINKRNPDIILFTGDLIDKNYKLETKEQEKVIKELTKLKSKLGKYAIYGEEDKDEFQTIMSLSEFNILDNEYDLIYNNSNNPLLLVGLNSSIAKNQNIEKSFEYFKDANANTNIYTLVMQHEPDEADDIINSYKTNILFAGHSHNGNIRIPFIKQSLIKKEGSKKYDQDYYKIKNSKLYISGGLGTNNKSGIRLFCRPSINFYRLTNEEQK